MEYRRKELKSQPWPRNGATLFFTSVLFFPLFPILLFLSPCPPVRPFLFSFSVPARYYQRAHAPFTHSYKETNRHRHSPRKQLRASSLYTSVVFCSLGCLDTSASEGHLKQKVGAHVPKGTPTMDRFLRTLSALLGDVTDVVVGQLQQRFFIKKERLFRRWSNHWIKVVNKEYIPKGIKVVKPKATLRYISPKHFDAFVEYLNTDAYSRYLPTPFTAFVSRRTRKGRTRLLVRLVYETTAQALSPDTPAPALTAEDSKLELAGHP